MNYDPAADQLADEIKWAAETLEKSFAMVSRCLVGQQNVATRLMMAMISGGHVLLEGLPGLAKTTAVKALGEISDLAVKRIQFTPDMLPADVLGTEVFNPKSGEFGIKKGPIFTNLLIADEINRAPAKVQSALLESMQEKQVTLGEQTFRLDQPFLVMATQNPIEQEGTYPLPEAQMDRFLFKVKVDYGTLEDEIEVVRRMATEQPVALEKVFNHEDITRMKNLVDRIHVADKVRRYIVEVVFASRKQLDGISRDITDLIEVGASPRASINLERASRINAMMLGRNYVTPQDVKDVGLDVLRHRLILNYEAEAQNISTDDVITRIFEQVDVP